MIYNLIYIIYKIKYYRTNRVDRREQQFFLNLDEQLIKWERKFDE